MFHFIVPKRLSTFFLGGLGIIKFHYCIVLYCIVLYCIVLYNDK